MKTLIRLAWEALFLREEPYAEMRDSSNAVLRGLGIIVLITVAVALVGLVGTALEWATTPDMGEMQEVVWQGLQKMDWYQDLEGVPEIRQQFDLGWQIFPRLFGAPNIGTAALGIVLLPLRTALAWLLYGLVAYLFARLLGGRGSLGQTLGCTALAAAPQLLNLATFFPYVVVGGVVGTWTILSRYLALKTCHGLRWGRALAATLLPYVALAVVVSLFACLAGTAASFIFGGMSR